MKGGHQGAGRWMSPGFVNSCAHLCCVMLQRLDRPIGRNTPLLCNRNCVIGSAAKALDYFRHEMHLVRLFA